VSTWLKIVVFLAFLVFLVLWTVATLLALARMVTELRSRSTARYLLGAVLPLDLLGYVGFFGIVGIVALFFDWRVFALLVLAVALGYLLTFAAWEAMEPVDAPVGSQLLWASARLLLAPRYLLFSKIFQGVTFLGLLGALAYVFFTRTVPSDQATREVFRTVVLFLALSFLGTVLPARFAALLSRNIDERVRMRLLVLQSFALFAWVVWISLIVSSSGFDTAGRDVAGVNVSLTTTAVLTAVFLVTSLLPYVAGSARGRRWRRHLLVRRRMLVDDLVGVLRSPAAADYAAPLAALRGKVADEESKLAEGDVVVKQAREWGPDDEERVDPLIRPLVPAYLDAQDTDPRFEQLRHLSRLREQIDAISDELAHYTRKDSKAKKALMHATYFEDERRRTDEALKEEGDRRNFVWIGATFVLVPVMSSVLGKIGERVWEIIDKTST
jgi:hypothetical protein